jgi:hypothetical protein
MLSIIDWQSKIQVKKGTPFISLSKLLKNPHRLCKGKTLHCDLISNPEDRFIVRIFLDGKPSQKVDFSQRRINDF